MSNQLLIPPDEDQETVEQPAGFADFRVGDGELDLLSTKQEPSLWQSLVANVRDVFSKPDLPPLELTSKPVEGLGEEVGKTKWSRGAIITSVVVNGLALAAIITFAVHKIVTAPAVKPPTTEVTEIAPVEIFQPKVPHSTTPAHGGGGGGEKSPIPAAKGKLPDIAKQQILPPTVKPPVVAPKLPVTPTVVADLKPPPSPLPNIGTPNGPATAPVSNGSGSGNGIGAGSGTGVGNGNGAGIGSGSGKGSGGGVYSPGNGVSDPELINKVEAEFSDEARKNRYEGSVLVSLIVGPEGLPHNITVVRHLGMGLDEKAVEAVRQYRFKPGYLKGQAVATRVTVEVVFHIY